jgi:hypothetical protein
MKLRFRRSIQVLPGVRLNLGKKGVSASIGPRGAKFTAGTRGVTTTLGVPGTGVALTDHRRWGRPPKSSGEFENMTSGTEGTWWKRLSTVLEVAAGVIGIGLFILIYISSPDSSKPPLYGFLIALIPAGLVRLVRIGVTYVIEGGPSKGNQA